MISRKMLAESDLGHIEDLLRLDHTLANAGISHGPLNRKKAHPLHRICESVFNDSIGTDRALALAKLFISYGSNINGDGFKLKEDTPLIAASSLRTDNVALLLIESGADIHHQGCMGGTALHWACWTGRDQVVSALLSRAPQIDQRCIDHQATPIFWAIHGYLNIDSKHVHGQIQCAELLLEAGADPTIPNVNGVTLLELLPGADDALVDFRNKITN